MLEGIHLSSVLFIDLETVSSYATFAEMPERLKGHWKKKCRFLLRLAPGEEAEEDLIAATYEQKAAIYSEFGKIVCISIGYIHGTTKDLRLKSFCGSDEKPMLSNFIDLINQHYNNSAKHRICGHNIREFDIPYLCRRILINGLELPAILHLAGKKPWETKHLVDTMQLWKFGDIKNFTSLDLLAFVLGVETPKDDIDGSQVGKVYWEDQDLPRIARYCEKDVVTVAQVMLRMRGLPLITHDHIISV